MKKELDALNRKLEKLEKGRMSLRDQLDDSSKEYVLKMERLEKEIENCKNKVGGTTQELQQVTEKYNALANSSKDIIALVGERDQLQEINQSLKEENDLLTVKMEDVSAENVRLARKEILHWFLAGSGVFFLGLIIGKLSRKKKRY